MSQKKWAPQGLMATNKFLMWKYNSNKNNSDPSLVASALNTPTLASVPVLSPNFVCALVSVASPHQHTKHVRLRDSAKWGP